MPISDDMAPGLPLDRMVFRRSCIGVMLYVILLYVILLYVICYIKASYVRYACICSIWCLIVSNCVYYCVYYCVYLCIIVSNCVYYCGTYLRGPDIKASLVCICSLIVSIIVIHTYLRGPDFLRHHSVDHTEQVHVLLRLVAVPHLYVCSMYHNNRHN
jgi:hypothetical protein